MSGCKFCDALSFYKAFHSRADTIKEFHEYNVALVIRSWTKEKGKKRASRLADYRYQGIGYKLNYCPECGKTIRKRREDSDG